ncbi:M15 family metallopeptidase [Bacillus aquiflavi]|uniref:M15 family metallopeptidase n=1 Tax=Bacillus aquiflavi TaxID=2672567 RepID=A0A6B3W271_9BACI|nr:D-alanyl-D-alanine carboxypeptidase family protein [Bacillus aquiflavi]MBA4537749.1 M15 family metallopeptidase [Bacillus aquiflavi]NEY82006.1 M15 family metallopeptidase [Bacillus aquiflavi]UAC49897.1 D-alanyl-D-alanine carboxypeptidase family protein [Bacillus aquiflavi]
MKKILFLFLSVLIFLSGCSILEKIPFLNQNENEQTNYNETVGKEGNNITLEASFFNNIKSVNGKNVIQNPENILVLVNKQYSLPDGYTPSDLTRPNVSFSFGNKDIEKSYLRQKAAVALEKMFKQAKAEGIELFAVSGYRSYNRQVEILNAEIASVGEEKAVQAVAVPGQSEHQTGLAMDISSQSEGFRLTESFEGTKEGLWLAENAHRFGFILRYPKGKEAITGIQYEPWHFRYVGEEAATIIFEKGWTLEEFFNIVEKI